MNENTEGKLHNLKLDVPIAEKFVQPMADTFKFWATLRVSVFWLCLPKTNPA